MRLPAKLLLTILLLALGSTPTEATTVVIQPSSQDAFVTKDRPNRIAGANPTNTRIRVLASPPGTQIRRGLVQFSLASIPAGSIVSSARAELYAGNNALNPALRHGLHRIAEGWLQSAVKWNNQPAHEAAATATALVGSGRGFKAFDVTPDVQAAVNLCAADHGWMVKDQAETATNDAVNYVALEERHPGEVANRPQMTVTFTPPACTTDADCADTNFCTTAERCEGGRCVVDAVSCDDGDPCTDDLCDCASGCINAPICNDGFSCTIDSCDPVTLACSYTPVDSVCSSECATGTCVADPDSTTVDPVTGCMRTAQQPDGTPCAPDAEACTADECRDGACAHPALSDATPCDDGERCTTGDACQGGTCVATPVVCTALDDCHVAGTCDPATGVCSNPAQASGTPCSDGNACTHGELGDRCDGQGACVPGEALVCTALDDCHVAGTCDPATGVCSNPAQASGAVCFDGDLCSVGDQCDGGGTCVPGAPRDCTPDDPCRQAGSCDPASGTCLLEPKPVSCEDPLCAEDPACVEICDNCVDDNVDGLTDRADPQCVPHADGQGTGEPGTRGKSAVKCQRALASAGRSLAATVRARLQRCAEAVFQCVQQKASDPACLASARARCGRTLAVLAAGPEGVDARLAGKIAKACGPKKPGEPPRVTPSDLCGASGLGYASEVEACGDPGGTPAQLLTAVSGMVAHEHRCRAAQLFGATVPRGAELLASGGVDLASVPCLGEGAQGGSLGLGSPRTTGRAAVRCQRSLAGGGARFVSQVLRAYHRCAEGMFKCLQLKPGDGRCRAKAETSCRRVTAKLFDGERSQEKKLRQAVVKGCGPRRAGEAPLLALADLRAVPGLGYEALDDECRGLGVSDLTSLDRVGECVLRQHLCRAEQLLTSEMPRSQELLDLGGAARR